MTHEFPPVEGVELWNIKFALAKRTQESVHKNYAPCSKPAERAST
jgi:hypothetical protein